MGNKAGLVGRAAGAVGKKFSKTDKERAAAQIQALKELLAK